MNFQFYEPNIKGAKTKVSTWIDVEETSLKYRGKSYTDKFKVPDSNETEDYYYYFPQTLEVPLWPKTPFYR